MGDLERIRRAARIVAAEAATGKKVAVVVSAMAGKTNELVAWTDGAGPAAAGLPLSDDEYDVVVASGEQVTSGLLAMTLRNMGLNARSWMGWQVPIVTDDAHGRARIDDIPPEKLGAALDADHRPAGQGGLQQHGLGAVVADQAQHISRQPGAADEQHPQQRGRAQQAAQEGQQGVALGERAIEVEGGHHRAGGPTFTVHGVHGLRHCTCPQ